MVRQESSLVERLCHADCPSEVEDWEGEDGYYVAACRVSADDIPGLIDIVRKWNDFDWLSAAVGPGVDADDAEWLLVTTWRTLADLKAEAAVEPLIDMLREMGDEFDDWVVNELPQVFGKIGKSSIPALICLASDAQAGEFGRVVAASGLRRVAESHPETRDRIVACLSELMDRAAETEIEFNTTLLTELVALRAVEAAEPIERAFANDRVDVGWMGSWEEVRQELGVEGLGLAMPEHPYDSIAQLEGSMGLGVFSDQPLFAKGEIDVDAEWAYYDRANDAFFQSVEAQRVIDESLLSDRTRPAASPAGTPLVRDQRVGRNELCPCGSGKKFKKCCRK